MFDVATLAQDDIAQCGAALRQMDEGAGSMEEVANRVVRYLYDNMTDKQTGQRSFALVRLFKTHPYSELDPGLQQFAAGVLGSEPGPTTKCLTLLATAGSKDEWNSRKTSNGHKAIPLASAEMVKTFPMVSNLVKQLGLEVTDVLNPDPSMLVDTDQKTYNVFHVPTALGSDYIVAQDEFVKPEGIKSVLGFGGLLPSGNLFVVIMFGRVAISSPAASMFKPISPRVNQALVPFETNVFAA